MLAKEKDFPRDFFFRKVGLIRVVWGDQFDDFKLFPDSQNNLGQAQNQRHQGVGQGQGLPPRIDFNVMIGVVQVYQFSHLKVFPDSHNHLGQVQHQRERHQGVSQG